MRDGFIKVAAGTPKIRVADCRYNAEQIFTLMRQAAEQGVRVLALPELCVTGYTCGDLFLQDTLLRGAEEALGTILEATRHLDMLVALGLPVRHKNKLYNCAAVIQKGEVLCFVPKTHMPNYGEFDEARWFTQWEHGRSETVWFNGTRVLMTDKLLFEIPAMADLIVGVELCEDLWAADAPSIPMAQSGATIILNLSASNELVGKAAQRRQLVCGQSTRLVCGYVYASAGEGESTTDLVFSGHNLIAEDGCLLAQRRFSAGLTVSEIDVGRLAYQRRRKNSFRRPHQEERYPTLEVEMATTTTTLTRHISPSPFVPEDEEERAACCDEVLRIAALGLKQRLEHTGARTAVIGLSGGLDSTLAILITAVAGATVILFTKKTEEKEGESDEGK